MFIKLLDKHIQDLKILTKAGNFILVYKGFPINFLIELDNTYPFLNDKKDIFTDYKIDLKKINDNIANSIQSMLDKKGGVHTLTYEEFILLHQQINLSLFNGEFIIFENNLFDEYPNQSTFGFLDIEQAIDRNEFNFQDDDIFFTFYSNSSVRNDINLIQYRDVDLANFRNIRRLLFFDSEVKQRDLRYKEIAPEEILETGVINFPSSNNYFNLKCKIFTGAPIEHKQIFITDQFTFFNEKCKFELKILEYIFEESNINLDVLVKKNILNKRHRGEFTDILAKYWKSNEFRKLVFYKNPDLNNEKITITQGDLIEEVVEQCERAMSLDEFSDIFLTAPTGSGKSVLFQIPAIYLADKYNLITIVVSPLKALMFDQVYALKKRGVNCAAYINSDIAFIEREKIIENIKNGKVSIIYLSPELLLSYDLRNFIGERKVGLFVIDEAHLVTTWGRDFRVDYWYLGNYIRKLRKYSQSSFIVFALTATAVYTGSNDIVFETIDSLNMLTPKLYIGNVRRDEIIFDFKYFKFKGSHELSKIEKTEKVIMNNLRKGIKSIIYFPWTKQIDFIEQRLPRRYQILIGKYYGDVEKTKKQIVMERFYKSQILIVMATKAFGMGVDINDIKMIYHHAPSGNLSDYVQEIGRVARDKNIIGKAAVDFCEKDLKFTKILYGLSSIKQYQVKLALQKINDLYDHKKKRNLLVSVEDFAFIFSDKLDRSKLETKVKSVLLLLEKDIQRKYRYNVLIVRPKSLFSTVFACVNKSVEKDFLKKYGEFCSRVRDIQSNTLYTFHKNTMKVYDPGDIFRIELDKIWEKFFYEESFPMVKRKFFERKLFEEFIGNIIPRYHLIITLKYSKMATLEKLEEYFSVFDSIFKYFHGKYWTKRQFESELRKYFKDTVFCKRCINLVVNLYTSPSESIGKLQYDTFLQVKRNDIGEEKFRVVSSAYQKVKHYALRKFDSMFGEEYLIFDRYICTGIKESNYQIKIGFLIESLMLGNYEFIGGESPQIFIRINDPYIIKRLLQEKENYSNDILRDIDNRHQTSVKIMEKFFKSTMDNEERWSFIEDYFLGKVSPQL